MINITQLIKSIVRGLRAITVQFYTEANVKNGAQFAASSYFTSLAEGELLDTIIVVGDKPIIIKAQYTGVRDSGDVLLDWYESPTYTGGQDITAGIYNQTEINPETSTLSLFGVAPADADAGNYEPNDTSKPVISSVGTKIQPTLVTLGIDTQGSSGSSARNTLIGLDHILEPNTTYLLRRTCTASTAALFGYTTWYEGEPDLPRKG